MAVENDVRRLAAEHAAHFGRLDLLVLNAGVGTSGPIAELPVKTYDLTLAVNLRAAFILLQETLPLLRKTAALEPERGAKIVALASIAGVSGEANLGAYAASKAALISLCQTVTLEESGNGVTATALCPGFVDTDMAAWAKLPDRTAAAAVGRGRTRRRGVAAFDRRRSTQHRHRPPLHPARARLKDLRVTRTRSG